MVRFFLTFGFVIGFVLTSSAWAQDLSGTTLRLLVDRKSIDSLPLGLNAFGNDNRFGSIKSQYQDVRSGLGIKHVRILFDWNDQIQSMPDGNPFFGFYDELIRSLPRGTRAVIVVTGLPSWMNSSDNWHKASARRSFHRYWLRRIVARYGRKRKVAGFQIWNEPNDTSRNDNQVLEFPDNPENYIEVLKRANRYIKKRARRKVKVVGTATTSILQNFPDTLDYNRNLASMGISNHLDIWGIHVYGASIERFIFGGVGDFLKSINKPIWITESGRMGVSNQLEYVERMWPYLAEEVPQIKRFYFYQYMAATPADETWGLRNLSSESPESDLYQYLKQR